MVDLVAHRLPGLVEAEVDGDLVALHIENGTYYSFNETAARIWTMLDRPKSVSALCATLSVEFDVDAHACAREVLALLRDLEKDGLVNLVAPEPAPA